MLRIGPEPTNGSISSINIRDNEKVVGILKEPTGAYSLDVSGTINCDALLINRSAFSSGSSVWDLSDSNTISYTNGNVGIGTTDPAYELDVSGDVGINGSLNVGSENSNTGTSNFLGNTDYSASFENYIFAPAILNYDQRGPYTTGIVFGDTSANGTDEISLITTGVTRVYIDGGKVGIGTTSPGASSSVTIEQSGSGNGQWLYGGALQLVGGGTAEEDDTQGILIGVNTDDGYSFFQSAQHNVEFNDIVLNPRGGNVGIGTTDPAYELDVTGSINCAQLTTGNIMDPDGLKINAADRHEIFTNSIALNIGENGVASEPGDIILFSNSTQATYTRNFIQSKVHPSHTTGGIKFGYSDETGTTMSTIYQFYTNGTATAIGGWSISSDERMKFDVNDLSGCLSTIQQLEPKTYLKGNKPNEDRTNQNYLKQESGFLAQDIQKIDTLKHLVSSGSPEIEGVETEMLYLDYGSFIPYLVGAMKEQQIVIDSLTAKNDALQSELTSLKTILQAKGILD